MAGPNDALAGMIGLPFRFIRVSYGDEFCAHFGEVEPFTHERLAHLTKGTCILCARASRWTLLSHPRQATYTSDGPELTDRSIEAAGVITPDATIRSSSAELQSIGYVLTIELSDGSKLTVIPVPDEPQIGPLEEWNDGEPLDDWHVFMPDDTLIVSGPGDQWKIKSSHDPV